MAILDVFSSSDAKRAKRANGARAEADEADILDTLKQEHDEVKELLGKLVDTEKAAERTSLVKQIKAALIPHVRAEEKVVYDAIIAQRDKDAKVDGNEGYIEHKHADIALKRLDTIRPASSPEFTAAAKVLKELVEHHIKDEESNVWRDVRKTFDGDQRIEMNRKYEATKQKVKVA
ncbi:MAG: hemerythrin domain-containing protein [Rhizomicrobium sp.]